MDMVCREDVRWRAGGGKIGQSASIGILFN